MYLAGLVQGVALVTFQAASSIFTGPHPQGYGFTTSQYGAMFLPQVILTILASSLAPTLAQLWHLKRVFLLGLGMTVMSANTYVEEFFPGRADSAVLALNA